MVYATYVERNKYYVTLTRSGMPVSRWLRRSNWREQEFRVTVIIITIGMNGRWILWKPIDGRCGNEVFHVWFSYFICMFCNIFHLVLCLYLVTRSSLTFCFRFCWRLICNCQSYRLRHQMNYKTGEVWGIHQLS